VTANQENDIATRGQIDTEKDSTPGGAWKIFT